MSTAVAWPAVDDTQREAGTFSVPSKAAQAATDLQRVVTHERLYAPGRLLHIQHPVVETNCSARATNSQAGNAASNTVAHGESSSLRLVDGLPDARFEMIAVRRTWIEDHLLRTIAQALAVAAPVHMRAQTA